MEFKSNVGRVGCHTINIGELLQNIDINFATSEQKISIPVEKLPLLAGMVWSKLRETFQECEGKTLVIEFGDSAGANAMEAILKLLLEILPTKSDADAKMVS